ncbi:TetR family transcriptional regulator [Paracerasibacillus soli]|uniref:TetR family transcriptional regulator n=1 Tax=Paracerasibacillus soli TaxID=480284 RepID=A0ABU5CQM5_9BACI|nr:TetR family transcriptional regulator [Virgibacillus soli]MDY0408678.1 TetR family transcriptional regulator [Virgibacillus soli]
MKTNQTKQKILDTASLLFYQKGFSGTSVRDIAEKASVNVSAISYYFRSKQGLLENVVTNYYEEYFKIVEENIHKLQTLQSLEKLKKLLEVIIHYKQQHHQMSCFIHRN